jgi:hypothetical protein
VPTNGVYLPDTNTLGFAANNNKRLTIDGTGRVIFEVPQQFTTFLPGGVTGSGGFFARNGTGANDTTLSIDITPTTALGPPPGAVILSAQSSPNTSGSRNLRLVADSSSIQLGDILGPTGDTKPIIFRTDGTDRARIDSSGRLLVGTSASPSVEPGQYSRLVVAGNAADFGSEVGVFSISRTNDPLNSGDVIGDILFINPSGNAFASIKCNADASPGASDFPGRLVFSTTAVGENILTERMRIDSSGRLLVGTSTADGSAKLQVDGDALVGSINGGPLAGFRNAIINGNFDIWQRGTSFTANGYGADRWFNNRVGSTCTMSRQAFTLGQTDVPGEPTYFVRMAVASVAGANNRVVLQQPIEDVRTFAGQQITISFYAKADASKTIAIEFQQIFGTGGTPSSVVTAIGTVKKSLTTSWQKITHTITVPSISGKTLGTDGNDRFVFSIFFDAGSNFDARTDSLGHQSGTFDIAQVQVEAGPVATPFERRSIGTELALCQRYFQVYTGSHFGCNSFKYMAGARTTSFNGGGAYNTQMRITPTLTTEWNTFTNCTESTHLFDSRSVTFRVNVTAAGNYRATGGNITLNAEL